MNSANHPRRPCRRVDGICQSRPLKDGPSNDPGPSQSIIKKSVDYSITPPAQHQAQEVPPPQENQKNPKSHHKHPKHQQRSSPSPPPLPGGLSRGGQTRPTRGLGKSTSQASLIFGERLIGCDFPPSFPFPPLRTGSDPLNGLDRLDWIGLDWIGSDGLDRNLGPSGLDFLEM